MLIYNKGLRERWQTARISEQGSFLADIKRKDKKARHGITQDQVGKRMDTLSLEIFPGIVFTCILSTEGV
jgi:hypothetical protein